MNEPAPPAGAIRTRNAARPLRRILAAVVLAAGAGLGWAALTGRFPPLHRTGPEGGAEQERILKQLRERVRGVVVYERGRDGKHLGLWKTNLGEAAAYRLTRDGRYPRFSPDGTGVAYLRGDTEIRMISITGRNDRLLHTAEARIPSITFHPNGREILFLEKNEVRSLDLAGLTVRTVRRLEVPAAVDISADGRRLIVSSNRKGRHEINVCLLPDGEWKTLGRGCSAAISPDGRVMTDNHFDHHYMRVRRMSDFEDDGRVPPPPGMTIDNEAWSNRPDWLAYRSEQANHRFVWLYHLGDPAPLQATFTRDADRPDVFVE